MMGKILLVLVICALADTSPVDRSPSQRYQELLKSTGNSFVGQENVLRYKLFSRNFRYVAEQNSRNLGYTSEANKFSVLTPDELSLYHGTNRTLDLEGKEASTWKSSLATNPPSRFSWIDAGHVTSIKNQDGCGACWTFGPVVAMEGAYKKVTGKLKQFSNQELLDCVYDAHTYNACYGGRESRAFDFVIKRKRLALWKDYPYEPVDKKCRSLGKKDGLVAAKVTSFSRNDGQESSTIQRLSQGPLSVAFHAVLSVHFYKTGIYKSSKCDGDANHAVAAVAYTQQYILIKNSWGSDWGDHGLFKFSRNDRACGIHLPDNNFLVTMESTGEDDTDQDATPLKYNDDGPSPTDVIPTTHHGPITDDDDDNCKDEVESCMRNFCGFMANYKKDCKKTCGYC